MLPAISDAHCGDVASSPYHKNVWEQCTLIGLTVSKPSDTVPTNLSVDTPREAMVLGAYGLMNGSSMSMGRDHVDNVRC